MSDPRDAVLAWANDARARRRPELLREARAFHAQHAEDPGAVLAIATALVADAERRPPDAPLELDGAAALAAELVRPMLDRSDLEPETRAYLALNLGHALRRLGPDADAEAQQAYAEALALQPDRGWWHHAQAELHKWRGRWEECLASEKAAAERLPGERVVALGVALAATALGKGDEAADAYESLGLPRPELTAGGLPRVDGLGHRRVRTPARPTGRGVQQLPDPCFELVWVELLSPCHGVVSSPSFLDAPIDYGDVILFDPARVATTETDEPVHPILERLHRGAEVKLPFVAVLGDDAEGGALAEAIGAQVFLSPVVPEKAPATSKRLVYGKLVLPEAAPLGEVRVKIEAHLKNGARLAIPELYERLELTEWAGKQHRAWRSVERYATQQGLV
ncbi:MAG: hypothetical protein JJ863_27815 [Deltaproteobacteria bacterium]|nr:hypothetical protein [Deltaproteobacteria bacterium]